MLRLKNQPYEVTEKAINKACGLILRRKTCDYKHQHNNENENPLVQVDRKSHQLVLSNSAE